MLTREELKKYKACLFLESVRPEKVKQTDDFRDQITFLRSHGKGNMRYYPVNWFENNETRTKAMYYREYARYSKEFNYRMIKYDTATKRREELEMKMLGLNVQENVQENVHVNVHN